MLPQLGKNCYSGNVFVDKIATSYVIGHVITKGAWQLVLTIFKFDNMWMYIKQEHSEQPESH